MDKASYRDMEPHLTSNARLQRCGSIDEFVDLIKLKIWQNWRYNDDDEDDRIENIDAHTTPYISRNGGTDGQTKRVIDA